METRTSAWRGFGTASGQGSLELISFCLAGFAIIYLDRLTVFADTMSTILPYLLFAHVKASVQ